MTSPRGRPPYPDVLTPGEWRIAEWVRHGLTNRDIADRLGVSPDAVKFHVGNVLSKLGFSSRTELRKWTGIRRDSALHRQGASMERDLQLGPLGQIARTVKDVAAARKWFADVLGLPHLYSFGNIAFFDCGGVRLFLTEGEDEPSASILYFRVPDIRAAHARLAERGVTFSHAPHLVHRHADGTEEWMAFFPDNEGRPLALLAQVRSPAAGAEPA